MSNPTAAEGTTPSSPDAKDQKSLRSGEETTKQTFTIILAGGIRKQVTTFRRSPGGPWTVRTMSKGRRIWRSTDVVGESKDDLALMRRRATFIYQELASGKFAEVAPKTAAAPKVLSTTIGRVIEIYRRDIAVETDISESTVRDNCRRLTLLIAEALGIDAVEAELQPVKVLTRDLVEKFQDARLRKVVKADAITRGRTRRTMDGLLNKARSLFTDQAMAAYRKAGLELPDMTEWKTAPMKGNWNSASYVPIADDVLQAMNEAAWKELRIEQPRVFLAYLMMLRLGMRNSEVQHARRCWIEQRNSFVVKAGTPAAELVPYMAITARPGWNGPKNGTNHRVPIAPDVLEQLEQLAGEDYILGESARDRDDITHRFLGNFVRRFLPALEDGADGRVKSAYELRKHFGALVASTQGLDRAAEYLGDRRDTVERHYHAWLQTGTARPLLASELPQVLAAVA